MASDIEPRSVDNPDDSRPSGLTAEEKQQFIAHLQTLHDSGIDISDQLGQGLKLDNGRVVERGFWDRSKGDLARIALLVGSGYVGGMLTGGMAPAAGAPALDGGGTLAANLGTASAIPGVGATTGVVAPTTIGGITTPGVGSVATDVGVTAGTTGTSGSLLSRVGGFLKDHAGTLEKIGGAVGAATDAAGKNRITEAELNMRGNDAYERQLMARSLDEQRQRNTALDNVYRNSWYNNRQASPYNTRGLTPMSDQFKQTLASLSEQGATKLGRGAQYDSDVVPALKPYSPTKPGMLERAGTWLSPVLTTAGSIYKPKSPVIRN